MESFLCRQLRFQVRLFLPCVSLRRPHCVTGKPVRPLVVPSEAYAHGGGLPAPLFSEGRQTEDAQAEQKKKDYENYITKKIEQAPSRIEASSAAGADIAAGGTEARHAFAD